MHSNTLDGNNVFDCVVTSPSGRRDGHVMYFAVDLTLSLRQLFMLYGYEQLVVSNFSGSRCYCSSGS